MKKHRSEKSHFDIANKIYAQQDKSKGELYRIFRVYHPVYELSVNIDVEFESKEYHIVEKYMDKLVCGYTGNEAKISNQIFVRDKQELFSLLGLEHQAYEVADRYFQDLILAGHYEITDRGIKPKRAAWESVKLQKKMVASTAKEKKLFDAFSMQLMPGVFYDLVHYSCDGDSVDARSDLARQSLWLNTKVSLPNDGVAIDQMIRNFDYVNNKQIERGLPQGYQRMSLASGEDVNMKFFPYYLAIFRKGNQYIYQAYRVDNGKPIEWIGEMYGSSEYRSVREMLMNISQIQEERNVDNPLHKKFAITIEGQPSRKDGMTRIEKDGNYEWIIQDWQIEELFGLGEDERFKRKACNMIAKGAILCLATYEAGKIVYIKKTEEQKKVLLEASMNPECDRRELLFSLKRPKVYDTME